MSKNKLIFSVITPTYNRVDKLHRVYKSIKDQTLQQVDNEFIFNWIVVDDGSSDGTDELVNNWQKEVAWDIIYIYQKNGGKPKAVAKSVTVAKGELTLLADSDDAFVKDTFKTFYDVWVGFSEDEKEKCGGIGVLCQDQFATRIGYDYPIENRLLPTMDILFKWRDIGLGETWAALKTKNLQYAFLELPNEAKKLQFIPESFFWDRIVFELKPYSYFINKVLRVYYQNEADNISLNIREKYPEGFLFESKYFIKNYWWMLFKYPKIYIKHLLKYIYFNYKVSNGAK